jgi:hypothetical protein
MTFRFVQYQTEFRVPEPTSIVPTPSMGGDVCFHSIFVISQSVSQPLAPSAQVVFKEGWRGFETDAFKAPFAAAQQKWEAFEPAGTIVSVFPEGWRGIQLEARLTKPLLAAEQQWAPWTAQPPYNTVLTAWAETTPRFTKPLAASEHPFDSWPSLPPYNTVLTAWEELTPRFTPRFPVAEQRWDAWPVGVFNTSIEAWIEQDYKFAVPFPVVEQQNIQAFTPRGTIVSVFPEGWRGYETDAFKAPFAAAQQRWEGFQPQGAIGNVVFVDGWRGLQLDAQLARPFPVAEQKFDAYEPQGAVISVFPEGWRGYELDRFATPFPAASQRWDAWPPGVFNTVITAWVEQDYKFAKPLPAAEQQWAAFQPQGTIVSIFPEGWRGYETDAFKAPFAAAQQRWDSFEPLGTISVTTFPEGWRGLDDVVFSDLCVIYQQTSLIPITPPVFNDFYSFELDAAFKTPLPAARQQWDAWPAQNVVVVTTVEGWRGTQLDYRFAKTLPAAEQKWDFWPSLPPYNTVLTAWQETTPRFAKPLLAAEQRFDSWSAQPPYNTVLTSWTEQDYKFATPFPVALQQNIAAFEPRGTITSVFPEGWRGYEVDLFAKPFPAAQQQWAPWPAQQITFVSPIPEGWRGFETDAFAKPFPVVYQKWDAHVPEPSTLVPVPTMSGDVAFHNVFVLSVMGAFVPRGTIVSVFPEGWRGYEVDVFTKHYPPAHEQQWSAFTPQGKITSIFPEGWRGYEVDVFTTHYPPAHEQQWSAWPPLALKPFFQDGWRGYEVDRFTQPFPAIEQQWAAWPPQVVIFPAALVPGGGKRVIPKQFPQPPWDVEPRKTPVWPIWDRVKWEEEQRRKAAQVPATRAPVEPPPQEIFRGPPRVITPAGLPSFREYTPPDAAGLARQMADARELADAHAAVRALQAAQAKQQNTDEDDIADALRALAALGIKGGGG